MRIIVLDLRDNLSHKCLMMMETEYWQKVFSAGRVLGVPQGTLSKWQQRGRVPARNHYALLEAAKKIELPLTHEELAKQTIQ